MKELISRQLVKYLEDRGVEHIFGLADIQILPYSLNLKKARSNL
jgi:thiamine pyrophosphate-dependent acetolactate synthase large subunit-like protein